MFCSACYFLFFFLFFFFVSGPFSACSIHVGPCARRPSFSQHAWAGGCWRGSPANARRQGVRAGRVRARQHYTLRRGGNSTRDAAQARCAATARMPLHLTTHVALAAARREVGTSAARARASKRMKGAHLLPTSSPNTTRRQRRALCVLLFYKPKIHMQDSPTRVFFS